MIKIKEIAFFAYAVTDMKRSRAFYEGILGLKPNSEYDGTTNPDYVEYDIGPTTLAIGSAPGMWDPSEKGASAALEVEDFDEALKTVKDQKLTIVMGPHEFPSCRMIVISDPDKNRITLHKRNKKAAKKK
jgi:predicted enzyme related to lactoylglutathione lyase